MFDATNDDIIDVTATQLIHLPDLVDSAAPPAKKKARRFRWPRLLNPYLWLCLAFHLVTAAVKRIGVLIDLMLLVVWVAFVCVALVGLTAWVANTFGYLLFS